MPAKFKIVIADTSCFILLDKIDELNLLKDLFDAVYTTEEIAKEWGKAFPEWIIVRSSTDKHYQNILELEIDKGEASAIALSLQIENSILILDDIKARKVAEKLKLNYTGTLGIILKAKEQGKVKSIKQILDKIKQTNFRLSDEVYNHILKAGKEN